MQFSAIIAIAFSSVVMASPSFMDGLFNNKVAARQECTETTFTDAGCTVGNTLFCSNVNFDSKCPEGQVERFDEVNTKANEEACRDASTADVCTMTVLCCPA